MNRTSVIAKRPGRSTPELPASLSLISALIANDPGGTFVRHGIAGVLRFFLEAAAGLESQKVGVISVTAAPDQVAAEVVAVARQHLGMPEGELEFLLQRAWSQAGLYSVPTRGSSRQFWRSVREDLLTRAVHEKESVSVMTAMVAADVMQWVGQQFPGVTVDHYSYPVGLLVAWVTAAALKQGDDSDGPDSSRPS